jgi:hypothetical protein
VADKKCLTMEMKKNEWKVNYVECGIVGVGHKTWGMCDVSFPRVGQQGVT